MGWGGGEEYTIQLCGVIYARGGEGCSTREVADIFLMTGLVICIQETTAILTDDVSLQVFMDHLKKLAVSSST